jgi:hypothetical protein
VAVILAYGSSTNIGNPNDPHHEYFGIDDVEYIIDGHDSGSGAYFVQVTLASGRVFYLGDYTSQADAVAACDVLAKAVGLVEISGL